MTEDHRYRIIEGDCIKGMNSLPEGCVQTCITSPPYFGLRDYKGGEEEIGQEDTVEGYVSKMVEVFRSVRRVLRDDGTVWLNLGDSYMSAKNCAPPPQTVANGNFRSMPTDFVPANRRDQVGLKTKDLIGIPWRVAFALQADGWYLRQDIIWHKPNPMPESVEDRCTKAHEYIFLLSKKSHYYYDHEAIREDAKYADCGRPSAKKGSFNAKGEPLPGQVPFRAIVEKKNKRSVWTVTTKPFRGAHFATFPKDLIEPCVLAGTSAHGCCSKCGSPYERDLQRLNKSTYQQIKEMGHDWKAQASAAGEFPDTPVNRNTGFVGNARKPDGTACHYESPEYKTVSWKPTCKCKNATVVPCTVFDPFTGSGTTCVVSLQNGRKFIGTELNPEYIKIARDRIADEAPMSLMDVME